MLKSIVTTLCAIPLITACASVEQRAIKFSSLSCDQLATALDYERKAEREARQTGVITGVASIFESGSDEDLLSLDSDMSFIDADNRRTSMRAIQYEQQRRCR